MKQSQTRGRGLLVIGGGLVFGGALVWVLMPRPGRDTSTVTAKEFHQDLADVGFDAPPTGGFRPLTWKAAVRTEGDVRDLISSLDLTPATLASGPYTDLVSIQSSIHANAPVLNTILAWSNEKTDAYLLRQRYMLEGGRWLTYGIVQDRTSTPNVAFYVEFVGGAPQFKSESCFHCHASGPRRIRPIRADLSSGDEASAAFNARIEKNRFVDTHFSTADPASPRGAPLAVTTCTRCHQLGRDRAPLYHVHDESIRALALHGDMPPEGDVLSIWDQVAIRAWLFAGLFHRI